MKFSIIFDNYNYDSNLHSLWGFSSLIETNDGETILFDTGSNGRVLLSNAKKMNIDFKKINTLFISHSHWDHIGGLDTIIEENPNITLIIPSSLSKHLQRDLKSLVKKVIIIDENFTQISDTLYSTGLLGTQMPEQSLIIKQNNKIYLISGCSHAGIDTIANTAQTNLNLPIYYIIGGFHMMYKKREEIEKITQNLTTKYITASHCTGDLGIKIIKEKYQENFIDGGVGKIIKFP